MSNPNIDNWLRYKKSTSFHFHTSAQRQSQLSQDSSPNGGGGGKTAPRQLYFWLLFALFTLLAAQLTSAAQGDISTIAGTGVAGFNGDGGAATGAQLNRPIGTVVDAQGNVYIADQLNHVVRKVDTSGNITTVAGTGIAGYNGDDSAATSAQLNQPTGVAVDGAGNLFIADQTNHRIRKVDTNGTISTVAGNGTNAFSGDGGVAANAELAFPTEVTVDGAGNLLIADLANHRVRKIDSSCTISTVAGTGNPDYNGDGVAAVIADLLAPVTVATDGAGNIFIADLGNNRIRKVDTSGNISTVAGTGTAGFSGDGSAATGAELDGASGVAVDAAGNLFIADRKNNRIRKVDTSGNISTIAGTGVAGYNGDGIPATTAQLQLPNTMAVDGNGNLLIADSDNHRVRMVEAVAGSVPSLGIFGGNCPIDAVDDEVIAYTENLITIDALANDVTLSSIPPTISMVGTPSNGTVTVSDSQIIYTSSAEFSASDTFTYTAQVGTSTDTATVTVNLLDSGDSCASQIGVLEQLRANTVVEVTTPERYAFGQSFTAPEEVSYIEGITAYLSFIEANSTLTVNVYAGDPADTIGTPIATSTYMNPGPRIDDFSNENGIETSFKFSNPLMLTEGDNYYFLISADTPNTFGVAATDFNTFNSGVLLTGNYGEQATPQTNYDMKFSLFTCDPTVPPDRIFLSKTVGINGSCGGSTIDVMAGTEVTYCYQVTNEGGTTLTNHTLIDDKLGTLLNDATFSLAPGMTYTFSTTASINVNTPSMATWNASVGAGTIISDSAEAYVSLTGTDLRVHSDVRVESVIAGDEFTFYIGYQNLSTITASDVWISSTLPAELSYVSSPTGFEFGTQTPTLQNTGNVVSWHMPELPAFASGVLYLTVRLSDTALIQDIIENQVSITTVTAEPNLVNNNHQRSINVAASFQDLEVEKRVHGQAIPGNSLDYTIYFRNIGNRTVHNVVLTDTLPANASYKSHESIPFIGTMQQVGDDVIFSIDSLAPNQNGYIHLKVDIPDSVAVATVLTNVVSITGDGDDANISNNSDIVTSTVTLPGRITGTVTSSDGSPLQGAVAAVTISGQWFSGVTDTNGHYAIENLPEGTYHVDFWLVGRKKVYNNVTVISGQTTPNIDARAFPPKPPKAMLNTTTNRVWVDPATGEWNIWIPRDGNPSDLTFSLEITCNNGALPTGVTLIFETESNGTFEYLMTAVGSTYTGTIPAADFALGTFKVAYDCGSKRVEEVIGHGLIDPSGIISDAVTGDPIVGATVTLYTIDGWVPKTNLADTRFNTCHTLDTRPSVWNDMPPALQIGRMGNPLADPQEIHPLQNPLYTDHTGYYAWDVAIGCWYIVVEAEGYETRVSPAVGVPPEVTDLHLTMNPNTTSIYLPLITSSP